MVTDAKLATMQDVTKCCSTIKYKEFRRIPRESQSEGNAIFTYSFLLSPFQG